MKILAFTDTHLSETAINKIKKKAKKADILVCAGDISWFGMDLRKILRDLNKIGKPVYVIPGNHEEPGTKMKNICSKLKNVYYVHKMVKKINGYKFFFWGGGGFAQIDKALEKRMVLFKKTIKKDDQIIFVTHGSPFKTELDYLDWAGHVGCKSQRKFIRQFKPLLHISGHLHENMHKQQVLFKKTLLVNPGPDGTILEI
jgi:uncharacterized protein